MLKNKGDEMQFLNSKRRVALRAFLVMSMAASTSGCLAMVAAPIAAGVATTAATNNSAQKTSQYARNVQRMNCGQLRQEYAKLDRDMVGRANPWSAWTVKIDAVTEAAQRKGCRLG